MHTCASAADGVNNARLPQTPATAHAASCQQLVSTVCELAAHTPPLAAACASCIPASIGQWSVRGIVLDTNVPAVGRRVSKAQVHESRLVYRSDRRETQFC